MDLQKEISLIKSLFMSMMPFIGSLIQKVNIVFDDSLPFVAAVDDKKTIYINSKMFVNLQKPDKIFLLAHETLHLAFRHCFRCQKFSFDQHKYNVAADCVVNTILIAHDCIPSSQIYSKMITPNTIWRLIDKNIGEEEIEKMNAEEIYRLLPSQNLPPIPWKDIGVLKPQQSEQQQDEQQNESQQSQQSGNENIDYDEYWSNEVYKAAVVAKSVGKLPADMERVFDLLQPKVNWRALLRNAIMTGMGNISISSWVTPNRKNPNLPGLRRLTINNIWFLIDTSGSITNDELNQAVSEIFSVSSKFNTTISVIPWDAEAYDIQKLTSPNQIKTLKIKGGGGTLIQDAVSKVLKNMKTFDAVIVITDGAIGDIDDSEVQEIMRKIAARSSVSIFLTTSVKPKLPHGWRLISITF